MNKLKKIRNRIYNAISSFMAVAFLTMSVFAEGNIANSVIATGTKKLIAAVTGVSQEQLTGIAIAVTGVVCVALFIARGLSDEQDKKTWDKRIKTTIVSGILAITITSIVGIVASYFGG